MPRALRTPVPLAAYSIIQASEATGIRPERLAAAARRGELKIVRIGTKSKISFLSLQNWIDGHAPAAREASHAL